MAIKLENTRLWQAQENKSTQKGDVRVDSIYGEDSDKSLLVGLESQEELTLTGITTANRLVLDNSYSNDPVTALAEWVAKMEAFVDGKQGEGYSLTDDERGDTKNVVIEMFGWNRQKGERYQVQWDMKVHWARGMMPSANTPADSVNPTNEWKLDGTELPDMLSYRQQKRQKISVYPIATADPGQNETLADTGATRQIIVRGQVTDEFGKNTFDDRIQALVGQDKIVKFESAFPGRTKDVMVRNFDSTREAGQTRLGEYAIEMVEGVA